MEDKLDLEVRSMTEAEYERWQKERRKPIIQTNIYAQKTTYEQRCFIYALMKIRGYKAKDVADFFKLSDKMVEKIATSKVRYKKEKDEFRRMGEDAFGKKYWNFDAEFHLENFVIKRRGDKIAEARKDDLLKEVVGSPKASKKAGPNFAQDSSYYGKGAYVVWVDHNDPEYDPLEGLPEDHFEYWSSEHGEHPMVVADMKNGGGWGWANIGVPGVKHAFEVEKYLTYGKLVKVTPWLFARSDLAWNHINDRVRAELKGY